MKRGVRIGLAVGFGYLLGRRRKLRSALVLAAAAAVGRYSTDSAGLIKRGTAMLGASPGLDRVAGLGGPLAVAGKAAATAAVSGQIDNLSGRLRRQADTLRQPAERARHRATENLGAAEEAAGDDLADSPEADVTDLADSPEVGVADQDGDERADRAGRGDRASGKATPVQRTRTTTRRARQAAGVTG